MDSSGIPQFVDVAVAVGADDIRDARGVVAADFDNDGDLDLAINNNPGIQSTAEPTFLINHLGQKRSWLAVELIGTRVNRSAVGSSVRLKVRGGGSALDAAVLTRQVSAGSGYASQQSERLYFGLGDSTRVARLSVDWMGTAGDDSIFKDLPVNKLIQITQGSDEVEVLDLPGVR